LVFIDHPVGWGTHHNKKCNHYTTTWRRWEIEIWIKKDLSASDKEIEKLINKATTEQRDTILKMKHQRHVSGTTKTQLHSIAIYKGEI
jgi:hypothetical protein